MKFCRPSNLITNLTPTSSTSVDDTYPIANLHDGKPTEVTRWETNAETRLVWDHTTPVTLEAMLIVMSTFAAGALLKVQANATNVWTAPTFSQDVTVPAWPDHLPANILADFAGTTLAGPTGFRYVSLLIPAQTPNHGIGEILWISEWETVDIGGVTRRSLPRAEVRRVNTNMTAFGVEHTVDRLVRQRRVAPVFEAIDAVDRDLLIALARDAGAHLGFPIVIEMTSASGTQTIEALYVKFQPDVIANLQESFLLWNAQDLQLDLLEIQRGLPM